MINENQDFQKKEWELVRFCSSKQVIGGTSKLFSKFVKDYTPFSIVSYVDLCWGDGRMYEKLNFKKEGLTKPGYFYSDKVNKFNRHLFTKKKLIAEGYDPNKTEFEIMNERKFLRVWDCGNYKYVWNMEK